MILTASYSPEKDAENYIRTLFDRAYHHYGDGQRNQKILAEIENEEIRNLLTEGTDREIVLSGVTDLLSQQPTRTTFEKKATDIQETWNQRGAQIIFQLEALYGLKCPFENITIDLTTISSCPYNYQKRQIFVHAIPGIQAQLRILSHELNHFFFYWKYAEKLSAVLDKNQLELLKESLTVFTNPEQSPYPNAKKLVEAYIASQVDTIDKAVEIGIKVILERA